MDEGDIFQLLKIIEIGLIASIKFLFAPFEAERNGFDFQNSFLITTSGGIIGIIVFTFVGRGITYSWKKASAFFKKKNQTEVEGKKIFTRGNKLIVRIKIKYGLIGLSIITPAIISIPVGTIVINHFYRKKMQNVIALIFSLLAWSILLNGLAQYLKLSQYLHVN
jgi:hypothetical protein